MIIPVLAILAPLAATGVKQYLDHKTDIARIDAVRQGAVVGTVVVGATVAAGFAAEEVHHRASLKHLVGALDTAVENADANTAAELISELRAQLGRKTLPHKLAESAERSIEAAFRQFGPGIAENHAASGPGESDSAAQAEES